MSYKLECMAILFTITFLNLYTHYEIGQEKQLWQLFYILWDIGFSHFLLLSKTSMFNFFIYQKHQCPINLHVWHFQVVSLIGMSTTAMILGKRNNPWYLLYFLYDTRFPLLLLLPKTSIWDSILTMNTCVQSTCTHEHDYFSVEV